jgi:hypothetical protein
VKLGTSSSCLTLPAPNLLFGPHSVYAVSFWCRIEFFGDLEASPSGGKVLPPRGVCPFVQAPSRMHAARQSCGTRGTGSQIHINRDALCSHTLSGPQAEPLQLLFYTNDEKHVLQHCITPWSFLVIFPLKSGQTDPQLFFISRKWRYVMTGVPRYLYARS